MLRLLPLVLLVACAGGEGSDTDRRDARVPDTADGGRSDAGERDGGRRDGGAIVPDDAGNCPSGLTRCGGACVDTDTEPTSCGACGRTCVITNAEPSCAAAAPS